MAAAVIVVASLALVPPAAGTPVATTEEQYQLCGRVFPDPQAYGPSPTPAPGESPWAKGNAACRTVDFIQYDEAVSGLEFLERRFPRFVEVYDLSKDFPDVLERDAGEGMSAGLPDSLFGRDKVPLYLIRVTDETVDDTAKAHFAFPLSIHGIERAGLEGGLRAAEDLATWAAETPMQPIMETDSASIPAGEALKRAAVYLVLANPDGWRRGDTSEGGLFYQRYNGNGVDMNRDWPTLGFTFRPYTPWSEPETRSFGKVLQSIRKRWAGGVDLHGQLIDRAFSFTLLGAGQHPYDKNQRILQFTKGAWADAEKRLSWSRLIKPNASAATDPGLYGVQWGTVWDTIGYTTTGSFGDWIDSPLGLGGDGIDNEMSLSHLSNCGTGKCYLREAEQLHIDGNKSLIYGMVNFSLLPEDAKFQFAGAAAYLFNPRRLSHPGEATPKPRGSIAPQPAESAKLPYPAVSTYEFEVKGPSQGFSNGGISAEATFSNVQGVGSGAFLGIAIDRFRPEEPPLGGGDWETVNTDFNQSPIYLQSGMRVDVNLPTPGRYRFRVYGDGAAVVEANITFTSQQAWPDPGQNPYDVSNMDFFAELAPFAGSGKLTAVSVDDVLSSAVDLGRFDTVIAVDDAFLPGYRDADELLRSKPQPGQTLPPTKYTQADRDAMAAKMRTFAVQGGNLVLTDDSLRALEWLRLVREGQVDKDAVYAGYVAFTPDGGETTTYHEPLAANVNQPGAAEGEGHRHQVTEPVPIGYAIQNQDGGNFNSLPQWAVDRTAWEAAGGRVVGVTAPSDVTYGELTVGKGRVRILGSFLPYPTDQYDHPFGLADYAITYSGYELAKNMLNWSRPGS